MRSKVNVVIIFLEGYCISFRIGSNTFVFFTEKHVFACRWPISYLAYYITVFYKQHHILDWNPFLFRNFNQLKLCTNVAGLVFLGTNHFKVLVKQFFVILIVFHFGSLTSIFICTNFSETFNSRKFAFCSICKVCKLHFLIRTCGEEKALFLNVNQYR